MRGKACYLEQTKVALHLNELNRHLGTILNRPFECLEIQEIKPVQQNSTVIVNLSIGSFMFYSVFWMPLEIHEVIIITLLFYKNYHDPFFSTLHGVNSKRHLDFSRGDVFYKYCISKNILQGIIYFDIDMNVFNLVWKFLFWIIDTNNTDDIKI